MVIPPNALNTPKRPQHPIKHPQNAPNYTFKTPQTPLKAPPTPPKHPQRLQDPPKRQKTPFKTTPTPSKTTQHPLPPNAIRIFSSYTAKRGRYEGPRAPGMTRFKNTPLSILISSPISIHPVMTA